MSVSCRPSSTGLSGSQMILPIAGVHSAETQSKTKQRSAVIGTLAETLTGSHATTADRTNPYATS